MSDTTKLRAILEIPSLPILAGERVIDGLTHDPQATVDALVEAGVLEVSSIGPRLADDS